MVYILAALLILLLIVRHFQPIRYAVHAARAKGLPKGIRATSRWMNAGFVRDENGRRVAVTGKFIGAVAGTSMEAYGLPSGSTFIADRLSAEDRQRLKSGELVVIDAPAKYSPVRLRLRCIDHILEDGTVAFRDDARGEQHTQRSPDTIVARVTHVVA
jgi:hypothetical protein